MLDTVIAFSSTQVSHLSGGSHWCLLVLIVESPIKLIDLTFYLVFVCLILNFCITTFK